MTFKDVDPRESIQLASTKNYVAQGNKKFRESQTGPDALLKKYNRQIIKIQAMFRAIRDRRQYRIMVDQSKVQSKYFTDEEARETLNGKHKPNAKIVFKQYNYRNGANYTGEWKGGFRHNRGTMKWPDGAIYEGDWSDGQAFGNGKFHHIDGDLYDGQWANNKANGFGTYVNIKGAKYEGYWKDDQQHGHGVEVWQEGSKYEGEYSMGRKEGHGKYIWADGSIYEGAWVDNRISGNGIYIWKDGRKYYGQWSNNDMEGIGIYLWGDGRRYEGQYHNDKKSGFGIYFWPDGRRYEGWWSKGKQHGLGTYLDPSKGKVKYGLWENGKRLKWFTEQEIKLIEQMTFDYTTQFSEPASANNVRPQATFKQPMNFQTSLQAIRKILKIPDFAKMHGY